MTRIQHWRPETRAGLALSLGFHVLVAAWLILSGLLTPKVFVISAPSVTITMVNPEDVPGAPVPTPPDIEDMDPVAPPPVVPVSEPVRQPVIDETPPVIRPTNPVKPKDEKVLVPPVQPVLTVDQPTKADHPPQKSPKTEPVPVVAPEGQGAAPAPLTNVEIAGLSFAISACWNLGSSSTEALRTSVTVLVDMSPDGRATKVALVSSTSTDAAATATAFEAARRAVIRCAGNNPKPLPPDRYAAWKQIEMTFDPSKMGPSP